MAIMKKLSMARDQIAKNLNEIPIKWGRFIDKNMEEQKVIFFGHEKAIYGTDGDRLDEKLIKIENGISDAFSEEKDYAAGDYCIYLNSLYRFTTPKPAGPWDSAAVIPVSLAGEMRRNHPEKQRYMIENNVDSIYNTTIDLANINLLGGRKYLIIGTLSTNKSYDSHIGLSIVITQGTVSSASSHHTDVYSTMKSGGGVCNVLYTECITDCIYKATTYGYLNETYRFFSKVQVIEL